MIRKNTFYRSMVEDWLLQVLNVAQLCEVLDVVCYRLNSSNFYSVCSVDTVGRGLTFHEDIERVGREDVMLVNCDVFII